MSRRYFQGFTYDQINSGWSFDSANDWSVCGWFYYSTSGSGGGDIFFQDDGTYAAGVMTYLGYERVGSNPSLRFVCADGTSRVMDYTHTISLGQWYHVAMVHDASAGTVTAYVDGVQVEQVTSVTLAAVFTRCEYGDFGGGNDLEIAQLKAWNGYALDTSELADEAAYWTPQHGTAFVEAWWQFEAGGLTDSSGNAHTITNIAAGGGSPGAGLHTVPGELEPSNVIDVSGSFGASATLSSGTNTLVLGASGVVAAAAAFSGAHAMQFNVSGNLATAAALTGEPTLDTTIEVSGRMSATASLDGAAGRIFNRSGTLATGAVLSAVLQQVYAVSGHLTLAAELSAGAPSQVLPVQWRADLVDGTYSEHGAWISELTA